MYRTSGGLQLAYLSGSYDRRQFTGGDKKESQLVSIDIVLAVVNIIVDGVKLSSYELNHGCT